MRISSAVLARISSAVLALLISVPASAGASFQRGNGIVDDRGVLVFELHAPGRDEPDHCIELGVYLGTLAELSVFTSQVSGRGTGIDVMVGQIKSTSWPGIFSRKIGLCVGDDLPTSRTSISGYIATDAPARTNFKGAINH